MIYATGILFSLVSILLRNRIKRIEKDIDETKEKSYLIERNYLSRFEGLNNKLGDVEKNIIREMYRKGRSGVGR